MKDFNKKNSDMIKTHLHLNWKLLLFFTCFWTLITFLMFLLFFSNNCLVGLNGLNKIMIGTYSLITHFSSSSMQSDQMQSMSSFIAYGILSAPAIAFLSITSLIFINKNISNEIKNGKIVFWFSTSLKRSQIIFSKTIFIYISNLIIIAPTMIIITFLSFFAYDSKEYILNIILLEFQFLIFLFLLISVYTLITIWLTEKGSLSNIIISLFIFWIMINWIISLILKMTPANSNLYSLLDKFKYISPYSLVVDTLNFSITETDDSKTKIIFKDGEYSQEIIPYVYKNYSKVAISIFPEINIILGISTQLFIKKVFANKNLNV